MRITDSQVDQMIKDVEGLLRAWIDRGISRGDGVSAITGMMHRVLMEDGTPLSEFVQSISEQWCKHGGKL